MHLNTRCNYAGSLGKTIPTRSLAFLVGRFNPFALLRVRW